MSAVALVTAMSYLHSLRYGFTRSHGEDGIGIKLAALGLSFFLFVAGHECAWAQADQTAKLIVVPHNTATRYNEYVKEFRGIFGL